MHEALSYMSLGEMNVTSFIEKYKNLLDKSLCPKVAFESLSIPNEKIFKTYKWECGMQDCNECGINRQLPWNCPVIAESKDYVNVWVWQKVGDQQETKKVRIPLKNVVEDLKVALIDFSKHMVGLVFLNQQRLLSLHHLNNQTMMITTDFSSQMDLVPPRKVNCHTNRHANLGVFCVYFRNELTTNTSNVVKYIECHEWYALGGCEEVGKQNDWIFHNSVLDYILSYYNVNFPHLKDIILWSDNCPGQVSYALPSELNVRSKRKH
jgi:hypothetical protein